MSSLRTITIGGLMAALIATACGGTPTSSPAPTEGATSTTVTTADPVTATEPTSEPQPTTTAEPAPTTQETADPPETTAAPAPPEPEIDGPLAPNFELALAGGEVFSLVDEAKPIYLVFWAEW